MDPFTAAEGSFFIPLIEPVRKASQLPLIGGAVRRLVIRTITKKVYAAAAGHFAQRHAEGGGRAYTYRIDWGSKSNGFGATHAIDLPLLFGDRRAWSDAELVKDIDWAETHRSGQALRELWARFARTGSLPDRGRIEPNVLSYSRILPRGAKTPGGAQQTCEEA